MTDPLETGDFSGHNFLPASSSSMQNHSDLADPPQISNSTQSNWTSDILTTSAGLIEDYELPLAALWVYFTVRIIWGGLTVFGNSLTILAVVKFERLQTCTNYLICNLAASDLLSVLVIPSTVVHELYPNSRFFVPTCLFQGVLGLLSQGGNMLTILYLSIDRYIYIAHPLRYADLVTVQRLIIILSITWIFCFLTIPILILLVNHLTVGMTCKYFIYLDTWVKEYYFSPQFMLVVLLTVGFHLAIARIAHKQARAIAEQQQPHDTLAVAINKSTKKISRTLGMVLGVYVFAQIPQFIMAVAVQNHKHLLLLEKFTVCLYWANTWVNPLIYAWRLKDFRIAFRKMLTGKGSFNEVPVP